jgi:hypothetical protein
MPLSSPCRSSAGRFHARSLLSAAIVLLAALPPGLAQTTGYTWGVVVGADRTLGAARDEALKASRKLGRPTAVIRCNDWYRTVFVLTDRRQAFQVLSSAQRQIRPNSYLVDLRIWCPGKQLLE